MDNMQKAVIALLKAAISGCAQPLPEGFTIEGAQDIIRRHHINALAYEGAVLCGISKDEPAMQQLFVSYCKALMKSEGQMAAVRRICSAFEENGIDYMPLKGCRMKALYPKSELRTMGDADILIRMEQHKQIKPVMEKLGFEEKSESDHEWVWLSKDLYLELHKRVIPSYNKDFYEWFGEGWQLAKPLADCEYTMSDEDELIYLFTHFAKHFRDGGIGCRHVLDLWVYMRSHPKLDVAYIYQQLDRLQLTEFYENIQSLISCWFEDGPEDEKLLKASDYIFASGSWGGAESHALSNAIRSSRSAPKGFSGKLAYIWQLIFMPAKMLEGKYTVLKKAPWLLPFVWIVRPFYKLLFERKSITRHAELAGAIKEEKIDDRQRFLHELGLDYNF